MDRPIFTLEKQWGARKEKMGHLRSERIHPEERWKFTEEVLWELCLPVGHPHRGRELVMPQPLWLMPTFACVGVIIAACRVPSGFSDSLKFPLTMPSPRRLPTLPLSQFLKSFLQLSPSSPGNAFTLRDAFWFRF